MKPYYQVFVKGSSMFTLCLTKEVALQTRKELQAEGHTAVYINKKKGNSSLADYHQGGY